MSPSTPELPWCYDVDVIHQRQAPVEHRVTHTMTTWLVDFDDLPELRGWRGRACRFDREDHIDPRQVLAEHGLPVPSRILMLAQPKVWGYVFNPLTVFYALDETGALRHVIAEVRNTYGGRHSYVFTPDPADATATVHAEKAFYVSPFYPVDGDYTMRVPLPDARVHLAVTLHRAGEPPFVATVTGRRRELSDLRDAVRRPFETRLVMAGIRRHGITLFAKGLRPHPRTDTRTHRRSDDDEHQLTAH